MLKNILQVYALVSCLIASIILLFVSLFFVSAVTDFLMPEYKFYASLAKFESNDSYLLSKKEERKEDDERSKDIQKNLKNIQTLSGDEVSQKRIEERGQFIINKKRKAIENLINSLEWICVISVYSYLHWRLYRRASKDSGA